MKRQSYRHATDTPEFRGSDPVAFSNPIPGSANGHFYTKVRSSTVLANI